MAEPKRGPWVRTHLGEYHQWTKWTQGWSAWRARHRLPEHVQVEDAEDNQHREAPDPHDAAPYLDAQGSVQLMPVTRIETVGKATGDCYACASHPGIVYSPSHNGEGLVPAPCPVCQEESQ